MKKSFTIKPYCVEFQYSPDRTALTDCKTSFCYVKSMKYPLKGQENVAFEKRAEDYYKKILDYAVTRAAAHQISFHVSLQDGCQFVKELILLANGLHSGGNSTVSCKWDCPPDSDMKLHEGEDYAIIMEKDVCTVNKCNSINGYRITLQVLRNRKVYLIDLGFAQKDYPFTNGEFLTVPYDYNKMEIATLTEDLLQKYGALERVERVGAIELEDGLIEW